MAKRFTDTEKWRKGLLRGLEAPYKLLWVYLCDECDHAGIWPVELDVASARLGMKYSEDECLKVFAGKVVKLDGDKWYIPSFVSFQYGVLNPENKAHKSVMSILARHGIKGLGSPSEAPCIGAMDKDMDKELDKDTDLVNGPAKKFSVPTEEEVKAYWREMRYHCDPMEFYDFYASNGWRVGKNPMKSWQRSLSKWNRQHKADGKPDYRETAAKIKAAEDAAAKLAAEAEEEEMF